MLCIHYYNFNFDVFFLIRLFTILLHLCYFFKTQVLTLDMTHLPLLNW